MRTIKFDPGLRELRAATALIAAALASFGSALALQAVLQASTALPVLAVVLTLTVGRGQTDAGHRSGLASLVRLPAVAVAAGLVGSVLRAEPPVGAALFVAGLSGAIWLRRFGPPGQQFGRLVTLPLIAVLVAPVPAAALAGRPAWADAIGAGMVAVFSGIWLAVVQRGGEWIGWLTKPAPTPVPAVAGQPAGGAAGATARRPPSPRRRPRSSTRLAVQLATALTVAFVVGQWLRTGHWVWVVLTAFIVSSGNRGRGDVVWKGLLRLAGAATGTLAAALVGPAFAPGDRAAVVAIFALLLLATWLRAINYAFWAAGITAVLAILYDYYGEGGPNLLADRLGGILLGALIAVAAAWFVLPVRTGDVARLRCSDALAALSDLLAALQTDWRAAAASGVRFHSALRQLEQIAPPLRAYRWLHRTRPAHLADAVDALASCAAPVGTLLDSDPDSLADPPFPRRLGALRKAVGAARRAIAGRAEPAAIGDSPTANETPATADARPAMAALAAISTQIAEVRTVWLAFPRRHPPTTPTGGPARTPGPPQAPARVVASESDSTSA